MSVEVRSDADDTAAFQSAITVPPDELIHLSYEWPRTAWSYDLAVRPADQDEWQTITWNTAGALCKKIVIHVHHDRPLEDELLERVEGCIRERGVELVVGKDGEKELIASLQVQAHEQQIREDRRPLPVTQMPRKAHFYRYSLRIVNL